MKNKLLLFFILAIAAFTRFWRIREYLTFLGDEGRDVLVVKRMLLDGKFTLLGPITSVGSIYMGPVYYYLTAPFLYLWNFDPVGPAIMVVLFSLATIYIIYRLGITYFHPRVGLIAAFTYAISRLTVIYGRSSWNPNIVPFFAVLLIFSVLRVIIDKRFYYLIFAGLSLGVLIQLHYVTLLFFPVLMVIYLCYKPRLPLKYKLLGLSSFLLAYSPFILFELRHQFVNFQGAFRFITENNNRITGQLFIKLWEIVNDVAIRIFWRPLVVQNAELTKLLMFFSIILFFFRFNIIKKSEKSVIAFYVILIWLTAGVLSFAIYRGTVYDYYLGSLYPVPHLLFAIFFNLLWQMGKFYKVLGSLVLVLIISFNIIHTPLRIEPNNMLRNTKQIADFVLEMSGNLPYNFALIADRNSDHAYRYFLELSGHKPVSIENPEIDPDRKTVTAQLLVVCEEKVCQPEGHSLWEIAGFGRAKIVGEWKVSTARVFKLLPYREFNND